MKALFTLIVMMVVAVSSADAQCAMCRAVLENNVSNGNVGIAAGINTGIMYLFFAPYLAVAIIGYLWYRTSKANERKELA
jgi:hypothetical protein